MESVIFSINTTLLLGLCRIITYNLLCTFVFKFDIQKYKVLISTLLKSNNTKTNMR